MRIARGSLWATSSPPDFSTMEDDQIEAVVPGRLKDNLRYKRLVARARRLIQKNGETAIAEKRVCSRYWPQRSLAVLFQRQPETAANSAVES